MKTITRANQEERINHGIFMIDIDGKIDCPLFGDPEEHVTSHRVSLCDCGEYKIVEG